MNCFWPRVCQCYYCKDKNAVPLVRIEGNKHDQDKPRISLILMSKALTEVAKVGTMGGRKYNDHNFRQGMNWSRLLDACMRHLLSYNNGDRLDNESKLSHLAHAAWNILALLDYEQNGVGNDDLFKGYQTNKIQTTADMSGVPPGVDGDDSTEE